MYTKADEGELARGAQCRTTEAGEPLGGDVRAAALVPEEVSPHGIQLAFHVGGDGALRIRASHLLRSPPASCGLAHVGCLSTRATAASEKLFQYRVCTQFLSTRPLARPEDNLLAAR